MSKIAKLPVALPSNVKVSILSDHIIVVGPKGELKQRYNPLVHVAFAEHDQEKLIFKPSVSDNQDAWAHAGTIRSIVNNMVKGVTDGFEITLELVGVGYRAQVNNNVINLSLGYSHPIEYTPPKGVQADAPNNTTLVLKGIDWQLLGQIASDIRSYRPPEPYKGKGIKYRDEKILRKETKKK